MAADGIDTLRSEMLRVPGYRLDTARRAGTMDPTSGQGHVRESPAGGEELGGFEGKSMDHLADLYRNRFPEKDLERKRRIWQILCKDFFQSYVRPTDTVLDIACGYGEFINNIRAAKKYGVDLNSDTPRFLAPDIEFCHASAADLGSLPTASIDVTFTSNFLEHLPDKQALGAVFAEVYRVLRPGGRFLIMGPNIRCVPGAYWDFLDHHLPLSHITIAEALAIGNFNIERIVDRFLPYTTRSALPQHPALVALYLKIPLVWKILGAQFFVVGRKGDAHES
jgi:SAM-dependent methyltransferase